jgi:small conductance mechanosensitive channel
MDIIKIITNWLAQSGTDLLHRILVAVIIAVGGLLLIRLLMTILDKTMTRSKMEKAAYGLIRTVVKTVAYVLLALAVASSLGIDVTGVVALASVATLAFSLALQNLLTNLIGGFTILYTDPFDTGDYVEIAGQSGTVTEVGMTYTKLTMPDNRIVSIPNSSVVAAEIVNYTAMGTRRAEIKVTASYDASAEAVIAALLSTLEHDHRVLTDKAPMAALTNYGDSAIEYVLRFWTNNDDYWDTIFDVNIRIKKAFDAAGIEMTYPHLNVHLDK